MVKDEGHAVNAFVFTTHEFFRTPNPKLLDDGFVGVRNEWEVQLILIYKLGVCRYAVSTNTNDMHLSRKQGLLAVADTAGLSGAARGVVFRVKVDH